MFILLFFAFLAGIVTVLSPCVLPVLPALLSAGAGKGNLRPIGIICGLVSSFTFFTLSLTALVHLTGISPDFLRYLAIALIIGFGLTLIFPAWGEKFAEATANIAGWGTQVQRQATGTGFWSGFILGIALGLVWTPCAGPILAAITTVAATNAVTWSAFWITLAYSLGAAIPMLLLIYGGKKVLNSSKGLTHYSEWIRKGFGILMILAALAIAFHYDVKFQEVAIQYVPLINIEDNQIVRNELQKLRPTNPAFNLSNPSGGYLPKLSGAPELVGIVDWVNTDPLTLQQLRGKVVLIDFWTYSCINCIRTFPYLKAWNDKYKDKGLVIIGVHTPEFAFEKDPANVKEAVKRFGITYPIAIDSNYKTWQNYNNIYWPAHYLIDQTGIVRSFHFGEGAYMQTENEIRSLLNLPLLAEKDHPTKARPTTPETYLGFKRADGYTPRLQIKPDETFNYSYPGQLNDNQVGLRGDWLISAQKITSMGDPAYLDLNFLATRVYIVMESDQLQPVTVELDGAPLDHTYFTDDMNEKGQIFVKEPRKYDVINLHGNYKQRNLTLVVPKGVSLYAFTFGDEP